MTEAILALTYDPMGLRYQIASANASTTKLAYDGDRLVAEGITSAEEVMRVTRES